MHPAGGFTFISRLCKPCLQDWLLFTLLVFCRDGAVVASSGTWKATGVERRPYIQQPFNHSLDFTASSGNYPPGTRLSLTAAALALFVISTDSLHWAAGGLTRRGLSGKYYLLGCGREDGEIITHHLGFLLAHTCSIIFGNECQHDAEAGSQHFGFKGIYLSGQALLSSCWIKDLPQLAIWLTMVSSVPSGFSHIWFKHATTQFSANS